MLLALTGVPALLQLLSLPFFPESPRYTLIQRGDEDAARQGTRLPCLPRRRKVPPWRPTYGTGGGRWGEGLQGAGVWARRSPGSAGVRSKGEHRQGHSHG